MEFNLAGIDKNDIPIIDGTSQWIVNASDENEAINLAKAEAIKKHNNSKWPPAQTRVSSISVKEILGDSMAHCLSDNVRVILNVP